MTGTLIHVTAYCTTLKRQEQLEYEPNLVNSKSYRLEILFRSIESSNDRELDKIIYNPLK